jgi:hypothetical protein
MELNLVAQSIEQPGDRSPRVDTDENELSQEISRIQQSPKRKLAQRQGSSRELKERARIKEVHELADILIKKPIGSILAKNSPIKGMTQEITGNIMEL